MQLGARHSLRNGSYSTVRFGRAAHQLHPHQQTFATTIKSSHSGHFRTSGPRARRTLNRSRSPEPVQCHQAPRGSKGHSTRAAISANTASGGGSSSMAARVLATLVAKASSPRTLRTASTISPAGASASTATPSPRVSILSVAESLRWLLDGRTLTGSQTRSQEELPSREDRPTAR
jgi:hypothetical protein